MLPLDHQRFLYLSAQIKIIVEIPKDVQGLGLDL